MREIGVDEPTPERTIPAEQQEGGASRKVIRTGAVHEDIDRIQEFDPARPVQFIVRMSAQERRRLQQYALSVNVSMQTVAHLLLVGFLDDAERRKKERDTRALVELPWREAWMEHSDREGWNTSW